MIKLSIIIPTYNSAEFIPDLANALRQLKHVEVLFIDDGSSDETINVIEKEYQQTVSDKSNISIIRSNHKGVSTSRNIGIEKARGDYITFIDADDLFNVNNLVKIINKLDTLREDIIFFQNGFNDITVNMSENDNRYEMIDAVVLKKNPFQQKFIQPTPWAKLFRTKFLQVEKIYFPEDVQFGEDFIFNVACLEKAKIIAFNSLGFYRYRNNPNSVSHKTSYDVLLNSERFFSYLKKILGNNSEIVKEKVTLAIINDPKRAIRGGKSKSDVKELVDFLFDMEYSIDILNLKQRLIFYMIKSHQLWLFKNLVLFKSKHLNKPKELFQEI